MAGELERLLVRLDADTTALRNALNNASRDTETWEKKTNKSVGNSAKTYDTFATGAANALAKLGAAFSVAAVANFAHTALGDAAALDNLAKSAGLTTDQFQALRFASRSAGVDISLFDTAVGQFATKMGEFRAKSGELYTYLRDQLPLGHDLLANTRNQGEALEAVAKIVANLSSEEDRAAFVKRALSESATNLIPALLKLADEGFAGTTAKAKEYGQVIDKEAIAESKKLKVELDLLTASLTTGLQNALGAAAGYINKFKKELAAGRADAAAFGKSDLTNAASIESEIKALYRTIQDLSEQYRNLRQEFKDEPLVGGKIQDEITALYYQVFQLDNVLVDLKDNGGKAATNTMRELGAAAKGAAAEVAKVGGGWDATQSEGWKAKPKPNTSGMDAVNAQHAARLEAEGKFTQAIELEYSMQVEKFQRMLDQELITEAQFLQAREDANVALAGKILNAYEQSNKHAVAGMKAITATIEGPVMESFDDWLKTGKVDAESMFKSILANMAKMVVQAMILKPLMNAIFGVGAGPLGMLGGLFGGFLAEGGPASASTPYIVGEKGPELFVPSSHGTVVPNSGMRGGSGSTTTYSYVIDARGADIGVADKIASVLRAQMAMQPSAPAAMAAYTRRFPTRR